MNFWKRVNRGLLLTVLLIVGIVCYLIVNNISHKLDQPAIQTVCEDYLTTAAQYSMLPNGYRTEQPTISDADLNNYIAKMKTDIDKFYREDSATAKASTVYMADMLRLQANGSQVVVSHNLSISSFRDFVFDGNTVKVTMEVKTTERTYAESNAASENNATTSTDTVFLSKVKGVWKVEGAQLMSIDQPNNNPAYEKYVF